MGTATSSYSATKSGTAPNGGAAYGTSLTTVATAAATVHGSTEMILVNAAGRPLYFYGPDTTAASKVTGQLAALWPPLVAASPTVRGATGRISSVMTTNGEQVAYNGHFLYTFVEDAPGQVTGQGVQNFFVATPGLAAGAQTSGDDGSSDSGYSSGYVY